MLKQVNQHSGNSFGIKIAQKAAEFIRKIYIQLFFRASYHRINYAYKIIVEKAFEFIAANRIVYAVKVKLLYHIMKTFLTMHQK